MDTVEFWVIQTMDMTWPRVEVLGRYDTYDEANRLLQDIAEDKREHLTIVSVTPIKRGPAA